jgi:hypothetical protein
MMKKRWETGKMMQKWSSHNSPFECWQNENSGKNWCCDLLHGDIFSHGCWGQYFLNNQSRHSQVHIWHKVARTLHSVWVFCSMAINQDGKTSGPRRSKTLLWHKDSIFVGGWMTVTPHTMFWPWPIQPA